mmetsp:Transcript_77281/g.145710  ORF Transcript_77281/g.145710 Transcript_77281/m.145710 type:complete len:297 (-) Transcript_77281:18-908(-)
MLQIRLARREGSRHRRAWLHNVEFTLKTFLWLHSTVVLVTPQDEVQEFRQHLLVDGRLAEYSACVTFEPVLMEDHDVEPLLRVGRCFKTDFPSLECAVQPLVPDVAEAVDCQLRAALAEEDRLHHDILQVLLPAKVVDETVHLQEVGGRQIVLAAWIVMVPMDHEDRHVNIHVGILIVDHAARKHHGVANHLKAYISRAKAVSTHEVHRPVQAAPGGLVVVKEIPAVQDEIRVLLASNLQDFLKCIQGISPADLVLLVVPDMGVCSNEYAQRVVVDHITFSRHAAPKDLNTVHPNT